MEISSQPHTLAMFTPGKELTVITLDQRTRTVLGMELTEESQFFYHEIHFSHPVCHFLTEPSRREGMLALIIIFSFSYLLTLTYFQVACRSVSNHKGNIY
jgi:hypothetical protein